MKSYLLFVSLACLAFGFPAVAQDRAPDAVEIHPEVRHVLFDNEFDLQPGEVHWMEGGAQHSWRTCSEVPSIRPWAGWRGAVRHPGK